jgi:hypothetical protein
MGKFQADALLTWFADRPMEIGKNFVMKTMWFPIIQAMGNVTWAMDCRPTQIEKGPIPEKRAGETT